MAENETATVTILHQPRPKTASERGRAFRERQKNKSGAKSGQPAEKPQTFANVRPPFANGEPMSELRKTTAELVASCQRGIDAVRALRQAWSRRELL